MYILPKLLPEDILIYLRKSRTDDPALTVAEVLEKHEQRLDEWAAHNLPEGVGRIPEANRFREVASGETIESRPAIRALLRELESPKYKALLIVEPQRLSRGDLEDIGRIIKILRYSNTIVITPVYSYDMRDERDRDAFERELKRGNEFLEYQKRIMSAGRNQAAENGSYLGSKPPYGYRKTRIKEGKRYCYTLEPDPAEAQYVPIIFDLYNRGYGASRIAQHLDELGAPTRTGRKHWSEPSIRSILHNVHYAGLICWNWRKAVKTIKDGEVVTKRPLANDRIVVKGKHVPLVDDELFNAVREKLGSTPRNTKAHNLTNPLAGLLFCTCGSAMTRRTYKDRNGRERCEPRYLCNNQIHCKQGSCVTTDILDAVANTLRQTIADFEVKLDKGSDDTEQRHAQHLERLEARLAELEARELSQWDAYTRDGMPKPVFDKLNASLLAEKAEVNEALCQAKAIAPAPVDLHERLATFSEALDVLSDPDAPVAEKNKLLKACVDKITYAREKPQLIKRAPGVKKGMMFDSPGGRWTAPEIKLDIQLRV